MATPALAEEGTVEGELVDARCCVMDKHGTEHRMCAQSCLKDGLPAGIVTTEGKFYVLLIQGRSLTRYAAEQLRVQGNIANEINTITPTKVWVKKGGGWEEVKLPKQRM